MTRSLTVVAVPVLAEGFARQVSEVVLLALRAVAWDTEEWDTAPDTVGWDTEDWDTAQASLQPPRRALR
jgi:hypothetical protein